MAAALPAAVVDGGDRSEPLRLMDDEATDVLVANEDEGPYRAPWPTWDAGIRPWNISLSLLY